MFAVAIIAVLIALALAVARALLGPTAFDRLLAANTIGTLAVLKFFRYGALGYDHRTADSLEDKG